MQKIELVHGPQDGMELSIDESQDSVVVESESGKKVLYSRRDKENKFVFTEYLKN